MTLSLVLCVGDRLPFITNSTGKASTDVVPTNMTRNFVISNYASTWPLDHDGVHRTSFVKHAALPALPSRAFSLFCSSLKLLRVKHSLLP
jgi:hypothetical protein